MLKHVYFVTNLWWLQHQACPYTAFLHCQLCYRTKFLIMFVITKENRSAFHIRRNVPRASLACPVPYLLCQFKFAISMSNCGPFLEHTEHLCVPCLQIKTPVSYIGQPVQVIEQQSTSVLWLPPQQGRRGPKFVMWSKLWDIFLHIALQSKPEWAEIGAKGFSISVMISKH